MALCINSCSSDSTSTHTNSFSNAQKTAQKKYGKNYSVIPNNNRSYLLCINNKKENSAYPKGISFFVYSLEKNQITYEDFNNLTSRIKWVSDFKLEQRVRPGNVEEGKNIEDFIYIINANSGLRIKKTSNQLLLHQ